MNLKLRKFFAVACLVLSNVAYLPTLSAQKSSGEFQVVETIGRRRPCGDEERQTDLASTGTALP